MEFLKSILHTETRKTKFDISFENNNNVYINKNICPYINDTGSYILVIDSKHIGGVTCVYSLSRSDRSKAGAVIKLSGSKGSNGEEIECVWNKFEYPRLQISSPKPKNLFDYTISVLC